MPGRSKTLGPGFMRSGLLFMLVLSIIIVIISTTTVVITVAATIIIIIPGQLSALSFPELTLHPCYQELQTAAQKEEVQGELLVAVEK